MLKQERFSKTGLKITAVSIIVLLVVIVFSSYKPGIYRFYIMVFLAFIGAPTLWLILREEKSRDRGEINMYTKDITEKYKEDAENFARARDPWGMYSPDADLKKLRDEQERLKKAKKSDTSDE